MEHSRRPSQLSAQPPVWSKEEEKGPQQQQQQQQQSPFSSNEQQQQQQLPQQQAGGEVPDGAVAISVAQVCAPRMQKPPSHVHLMVGSVFVCARVRVCLCVRARVCVCVCSGGNGVCVLCR